jgi:hypothetical protein
LQELFGQRLGIEIGARRTASNWTPGEEIELKGLYLYTPTGTARDQDLGAIRGFHVDEKNPTTTSELVKKTMESDPAAKWLVVRILVKPNARDADVLFRFSPASARLVIRNGKNSENYYPVGTIDYQRSFVWVNRIDDPMALNVQADDPTIDLVYKVPASVLQGDTDPKKGGGTWTLPAGSFFEMKRLARADVNDESEGGGPIKVYDAANAPHPPAPSVMRKVLQDERLREKKEPQ